MTFLPTSKARGTSDLSRASFFCAIMAVTLATESTKASLASWASSGSHARGGGGLGAVTPIAENACLIRHSSKLAQT
jgi:hypothetical protein